MKNIVRSMIFALCLLVAVSCTQYVFVPIPSGGSGSSYDSVDIAKAIPEELLAWYGLQTDKTKLPEGVEVNQEFVEGISTASLISGSRAKASARTDAPSYMLSTIKLTGFIYQGFTYNSEAIYIVYSATNGIDGTKYDINDFTIQCESVEVTPPDSSDVVEVAIKGITGKLQDDTASTAVEIEVSSTTIVSVTNIPTSSDSVTTDSWTGSYVVEGEEVSKPASEGMTGSIDEPYLIRTLDDIAKLQDMFDDADKVNIKLMNDIEITTEWIANNLISIDTATGDITAQPITVAAGQDVTLDFNHHTIMFDGMPADFLKQMNVMPSDFDINTGDVSSYAALPFVVSPNGKLTINNGSDNSTDVGGVKCTDQLTCGVFRTYGTLIINGGRFETCGNTKSSVIRVEETGDLTINNAYVYCSAFDGAVESYGKMTINDGYYYTNSHNGGRFKYCIISGGDMILNGGEYYGIQGGISLSGGTATINYAESYVTDKNDELGYTGNKSYYALYVSGEDSEGRCVINDGIFKADQAAIWVANSNEGGDGGLMLNGMAIINGGFFKSNKQNYDVQIDYEIGSMTLNGGTFAHNSVNHRKAPEGSASATLNDFLGDGYMVQQDPDTQLYEVVKEN